MINWDHDIITYSIITNHIIIKVTGIPWNSTLQDNRNKKISQRKKRYSIIKIEKKSSTTVIKKLVILNKITDRNNNNYSNIFKRLYR